MKKRLMVTGSSGFVGGSVITQASPEWEVHALSGKEAPLRRESLNWHRLDLLDQEALRQALLQIRPQALIHAAAIADIDYCQQHPQIAEQVNVGVTRELAALCREHHTRMVHCSTDTVFDGHKGNYTESDATGVVNHYGQTKLDAEQAVVGAADDFAIARLALVMGLPLLGAGNTFLPRMIAAFREGREFGAPDDEIRTPIDVITLGRALLELAGNDLQGCIHLAGNDVLNRFEMAQRIAERLGCPRSLAVVKNASAMPGRAPRPRDVSLNNSRAKTALRTPMCGLEQGLELVLATGKGVSA